MVGQVKYCNIPTDRHHSTIYLWIYRFDRTCVRQIKLEKKNVKFYLTPFVLYSLFFIYLFIFAEIMK